MALSSFGISTDYSSALRFGLVNIRPVQVVETMKRFGIKFRRVSRTFETLKSPESYDDFVTIRNEVVFAKIEVPDWFEAEKLVGIYSQRSIKSYKEDTELQQAIEELRKSNRIGRPLLSFVQFAMDRFESRREKYLEAEAVRFLYSNFPLSFYNKFVVFDNAYYDFLKILEQTVRLYEFRARCARNFEMYRRHINQMKERISPIIDQMDNCCFLATCLRKYVTIWNARTYKEINEQPEFLDIDKIDYSKFEQLNKEFGTRLTETRKFLLKYDPNILRKELSLENEPTAKMFGKLIMLPSSSLNLERRV